MTERLHYTDSRCRAFDAQVVAMRYVADVSGNAGDVAQVQLDRSAFYPASGGQPADKGTLGSGSSASADVTNVIVEDGEVWHQLAPGASAPTVGKQVHGELDWTRRYDLMQQHSGQHLLSQVFERLLGWETLSVHMGEEENTLDLDTPGVDQAQLDAVEAHANEMVAAALPVRAYFVTQDELAKVPLRRPPKVSGLVRIVEIAEYDYSACGGTHVRTTAEVGQIRLLRSERRRGGVRITFLCGGRAQRDIARKQALLVETAALFSSDIAQIPLLVQRNLERVKELQRRNEELTERLLVFEAERLLRNAESLGNGRLVAELRDDLDATSLRTLANVLTQQPGVVALIASVQEGKLLLVFARGAETPQVHLGNLLRDTLQQAGGKGGGRPDFAQGGGVDASHSQALLAFARAEIVKSNQ